MPIKNEKGNVVLFLASHKDVTKRKISGEFSEQDVGMQIFSIIIIMFIVDCSRKVSGCERNMCKGGEGGTVMTFSRWLELGEMEENWTKSC